MPGICFTAESLCRNTQDAIQEANLLKVLWTFSEAATQFDVKGLFESFSLCVNAACSTERSEVVPMYHHGHTKVRVEETTWGRFPLDEAHPCKRICEERFPNCCSIPRPIAATDQPPYYLWAKPELFG